MTSGVIDVLRRFLPDFLASTPRLSVAQRRAVRAIIQCRTPAMGGHIHACEPCGQRVFTYHSCNHKACPQCGRQATRAWVERELAKRVGAPYFMVTFTLPSELRGELMGPNARDGYNAFLAAASTALRDTLANPKWLGAATSGFTAVLHTWNQQLHFHPHLHMIVPGAGIDRNNGVVTVKGDNFLVPLPVLRTAFRQWFRKELATLEWQVDPTVWRKDWGVDIRPFGSGANAIKYLGAYVCRTAIGDSRIVAMDDHSVTFRWKDRAHGNAIRTSTIPGIEFVARYIRHVLPQRMHSIRRYGFCHPAAKANRMRIAFHTGRPLVVGPVEADDTGILPSSSPLCKCCGNPMRRTHSFDREGRTTRLVPRGPPAISKAA